MGGSEMLLIGLALLLFFGGKKLPELMRGLGKGIREFQDAKNDVKEQITKELDEDKK
jgi:sec-independent protein translocase protein TatA